MKDTKVTIGVCVKDCAATIKTAIKSIIRQDFPHEFLEVIFVDDGSIDNSLSLINNYVSRMDISAFVFHQEWKGLGPSRELVIDNARGKYVVWVDGDMVLTRDFVRKQVEFMDKHPEVGIGKGKYGLLNTQNHIAFLENVIDLVDDAFDKSNVRKEPVLPGTGGAIFRVKAVVEVGGFDKKIKGVGEDQEVAYRMQAAGWLIQRTQAVFFEKRETTVRSFWDKYFWYGQGNYLLYCKNREIFSLYRMSPPTSFFIGMVYAANAQKLTHQSVTILLPFHFLFKSIAWFFGFFDAQVHHQRSVKQ